MSGEHNNELLIKKVVKEFLNISDPVEAEKWEKYLIYIMLS